MASHALSLKSVVREIRRLIDELQDLESISPINEKKYGPKVRRLQKLAKSAASICRSKSLNLR